MVSVLICHINWIAVHDGCLLERGFILRQSASLSNLLPPTKSIALLAFDLLQSHLLIHPSFHLSILRASPQDHIFFVDNK